VIPGPDPQAPVETLLTRHQLARLLGCSARTLDRDRAAGLIPDPLPRPGKNPRWLASEIHAWLAAGTPDRDTWDRLKPKLTRQTPTRSNR